MQDDEDPAAIVIECGVRGSLSDDSLAAMSPAPAMVAAVYPGKPILIGISGYEDDPRSLWEIPEVVVYLKKFAKASGISNWRSDLYKRLDDHTKVMLIMAKALDEPHPFRAVIAEE